MGRARRSGGKGFLIGIGWHTVTLEVRDSAGHTDTASRQIFARPPELPPPGFSAWALVVAAVLAVLIALVALLAWRQRRKPACRRSVGSHVNRNAFEPRDLIARGG